MDFKQFVKEENQLKNIERFKDILKDGGLDLALMGLSFGLHMNQDKIKSFALNGVLITDTEVYKKYLPIFLKIYSSKFDKFDLLKPFGFSEDDIQEFKVKNPDKEKVASLLNQRLGIKVDPHSKINKIKEEEVVSNITNRVNPEINKEINDSFYFAEGQINSILNGITDYVEVDKQSDLGNDKLKDHLSMTLYSNAFEIYLKILRDIYAKEKKMSIKNVDNRKLYPYFRKNYPELLESVNNKLRNDVCHLNYDERGKYTRKQVDEARTDILFKSITALIARNEFIVSFFDESINIDNKMEKFVEQIIGLVDKEDDKNVS
ncbi:MAG: hypothetical protein KAT05_16535 [Spirochaetes bacterium]|nr:hypothetical protein [Spirochaetota bacterium]